MKLKIKHRQILYGLIAVLTVAAIVYGIVWFMFQSAPVSTIYYKGIAMTFRQDVKQAEKVKVTPSEQTLGLQFWDYKNKNIKFLFKPENKSNGLYRVEVFELTYKLSQMYMTLKPLIIEKNFSAEPIESYDNITKEEGTLKVVLIPPGMTNETAVRVTGNGVFIQGKDEKDFDLAVIKTILSSLTYNGNYTYVTS